MKIDVLTLFPKMFKGPFSESIVKRAREDGKIEIKIHNLRDWAKDKHKTVDTPPYGGGAGMVMRVDVIDRAVVDIRKSRLQVAEKITQSEQSRPESRTVPMSDFSERNTTPGKRSSQVVLLDTKGSVYNQGEAEEMSKLDHLILIAGHYEGVDHRVHEHVANKVISIGKYVLTGGEIPVMAVVDSVTRLLPGVLGNKKSLEDESYSMMNSTSEESWQYPQYTRPEEYKGWKVPKVLLSGDHARIKAWRKGYFFG